MAIAASNTTCPAAALVAEIEGYAKAISFVSSNTNESWGAMGESNLTVDYVGRCLRVMKRVAADRIETVRAVELTGAAFQVTRLREIFGDLQAIADPCVENRDISELMLRFEMVFESVIECLALNGGQLPPNIVDEYELGPYADSGVAVGRVIAVAAESAAAA